MKHTSVLLFAIVGTVMVIGGGWYKQQTQIVGDLKIPSIPKQSCLEHNTEKHMKKTQAELAQYQRAYFAGGCFWCTESDLQKATGVAEVISGYAGGSVVNPTYSDVTSEKSGHREAVEIYYDGKLTTYENLVQYHLLHIDPTDAGGQFYDRGESYQAVIFYASEEERLVAERAIQELNEAKVFDKPVVVRVLPYKNFYTAEEYHQNYAEENTVKYCAYRESSGRDVFLKKHFGTKSWGELVEKETVMRKADLQPRAVASRSTSQNLDFSHFVKPSDTELRTQLTDIQYDVTQKDGTERPFQNIYNENHAAGIYVDIVSGEPLYSSDDKYDSGTGWPSFVKPIDSGYIVEKVDRGFFGNRTEIRSKYSDNHLGHVFTDGPADRGGMRYCMNSAALRFIPREAMEKEGYGNFLARVTIK
ncbi:MAG: peptide-methionine (R)-S-oxide reductase MsrB [Candidatus Moranbacteria bacterium]|nr:peptide-methionine (R)-S-oxide reductase MsrB [Candidatus Moranbacteria bacterium]